MAIFFAVGMFLLGIGLVIYHVAAEARIKWLESQLQLHNLPIVPEDIRYERR